HGCGAFERFAIEMKFGFSRRKLLHFNIFPLYAGGPSCAERLEASFLCSEARGIVNCGIGAVGAVGNFDFRIYSIDEPSAKSRDRISDAVILNKIDAKPDNHELMLQVKRVSQI